MCQVAALVASEFFLSERCFSSLISYVKFMVGAIA